MKAISIGKYSQLLIVPLLKPFYSLMKRSVEEVVASYIYEEKPGGGSCIIFMKRSLEEVVVSCL